MNKDILVIDDEPGVLKSVAKALRRKGYSVFEADNPDVALSLFLKRLPQLVITDCTAGYYCALEHYRMEEENKNLIEAIKEMQEDAGIIVMSGYFSKHEIEQCIAAGAFRCLDKPFSPGEPISSVEEYFKESGLP